MSKYEIEISLTNDMQHFSSKIYRLLLREIKEYLNDKRDAPCLCIRRLSTVKTSPQVGT